MAKDITPMGYLTELDERLGVKEEMDLTQDEKIIYLNAQIEEMKKFLYRNRVDVLFSENLINSNNSAIQNKGHQNKAEYTTNSEQCVAALRTLIELRDQLDS